MIEINIKYDYRLDSKCGDPDTDSPKLYKIHSSLWNRKISKNEKLELKLENKSYGRLILKTNLTDNLSSDRMCPHFVGKYNGRFDKWLSKSNQELFQQKVRTIGGHIVFPAHRKEGFTINQARGVNRKISDRFDLTLECIRRFYSTQESPLSKVLTRYSDFFKLFQSFKGYTDFFLLQDFLNKDKSIDFSIPFDNFERSALPISESEYKNYMIKTVEQIDKRNNRIENELKKTSVQHGI